MKNAKQAKSSNYINPVPKMVFTPFKTSKIEIIILSIVIFGVVLFWGFKHVFSKEELQGISELVINMVLVMGTLGITAFALPIDSGNKNIQPKKRELVLSYLGKICVGAALAMLGYILSILWSGGDMVIKSYSIAILLYASYMMTQTVAMIVAYFNVQD